MPIIVSATGPGALPTSQEEVEERRKARLAKKAAAVSEKMNVKKRTRVSVTEGMTNDQKLVSAISDRKLIKFVLTPDPAVKAAGWPDAPAGLHVVLPGLKGHRAYIFNIKERLKEKGFQWNPDKRLWWRFAPFGINDKTVE
jgi:hypothetical protein